MSHGDYVLGWGGETRLIKKPRDLSCQLAISGREKTEARGRGWRRARGCFKMKWPGKASLRR